MFGASRATFSAPPDVTSYASASTQFFPRRDDEILVTDFCGGGFDGHGCWNFTRKGKNGAAAAPASGGGWQPGSCGCDGWQAPPAQLDLLSGMMQRVVAAVLNGSTSQGK